MYTDIKAMKITSNIPTPKENHLAEKLRPIRLALKVAESLLSRGVSTRDTVSQALDITERYCKERVYFDVSSTVITASQYRGLYKDPLTLMMTIRYEASNNMIVQELQQLVRDIVNKNLSLETAIERYEYIEKYGKKYPGFVRTIGNAGMASGIVMLFTDSWVNILLTFVTACLADLFMQLISRRRIPPFFAQALAATTITLIAASFAGLNHAPFWNLGYVDPTLITVGGIMMLVAGLSLAATAQDAIDEYYVTASARLVKTAMLTVGIIVGIIASMTLVSQLTGVTIITEQSPAPSAYTIQIIGAAITAASWAIYTQSSFSAIIWAAIISSGGFMLYKTLGPTGDALASGIASLMIGFSASIIARFWKFPSISIINSAIVILVPGYMLYRGLMHFVGNVTPGDFMNGSMIVISATTIALAISAGAALGTYIGRPVRSHMVRIYKYVPQLISNPLLKKRRKQ